MARSLMFCAERTLLLPRRHQRQRRHERDCTIVYDFVYTDFLVVVVAMNMPHVILVKYASLSERSTLRLLGEFFVVKA